MALEMLLAVVLYAIGFAIFHPFEERSSVRRRVSKLLFYFGIAALLSWKAGRVWAISWIVGMMVVGLTFHVWWTTRHGIGIFKPEPREKYYRLRGWR